MKSELLLALAAAAVVLQVSESKIFSKCELKEKLQRALPLPRQVLRMEDRILALITCEVERRSNLDSNMVSGTAVRPQEPPTAAPDQVQVTGDEPRPTLPSPIVDSTGDGGLNNHTAAPSRRKRGVRHGPKMPRWGSDESQDSKGSSEKKQKKSKKGGEHSEEHSGESSEEHHKQEMENHGSMNPTAQPSTSAGSDSTAGHVMVKRGASRREKSRRRWGSDESSEASREKKGKKGKKGTGDNHSVESSEEHHKQEMENHGSMNPTAQPPTAAGSNSTAGHVRVKRGASGRGKGRSKSGSDESNDESKERKGKKSKGDKHSAESASQEISAQEPAGYYGLFQLTDSWMCDSGDGQSRNECGSSCDAFTDDDIDDDVQCFVETGHWRYFLVGSSSNCVQQWVTYFEECP